MKILLADRCPLVCEGIKPLLHRIDPHIVIAETADYGEAVQLAEQHEDVKLILLGLAPPRQHGLDALRHIRARLPDTPIIVLSDFERSDDIRHVLDNGASGYISKSCDRETMFSAIKLVLSGGVYLSPTFGSYPCGRLDAAARRCSDAAVIPDMPTPSLTKRQHEVLRLLAQGMTNKQIGRTMAISHKTVKTHITTILKALDVSNRTEAGAVAARLGLGTQRINKIDTSIKSIS